MPALHADEAAPGDATIHSGVQCNICGSCPIIGVRHRSLGLTDYDACSTCVSSPAAQSRGPFEPLGHEAATNEQASSTSGKAGPGQARLPQPKSGRAGGDDGAPRHAMLMRWVWDYFSVPARQEGAAPGSTRAGATAAQPTRTSGTVMAHKPPLYLQHQGHSR